MNVKMTRTFHPVGQGAFYSEEFCQGDRVIFRVVYDCGCRHGKANQQHGEAVVKDWMGKWNGDTRFDIDYLFISHFDFDHVSLLKVFADGGARIGRVILPLLNDGEKEFLTDLYCNVHDRKSSGFLQSLIEKPEETLRAKVTRVEPVKDAKMLVREDFKEEDASDVLVPSGTRFPVTGTSINFDWFYMPCNYDDVSRGDALRNVMKNKFGNAFDPCDLKAFSGLMKHWGRGKKFVAETGIDALAASFGTAHGIYKVKPKLDFDRIRRIRELTGVPLVMHGGSGVSPEDYRTAISCGIRKINYYSYMARAGKSAVAAKLAADDVTFFHLLAAEATRAMEADVARAMGVFIFA